mmetsp:Transcript_32225/g.53256  ORF Transcript_32225/g.53256 Transcript_32225/m.53256 type:complete len:216 (+) Transcript_32225:19-666(+)
MLIMLLLPLRMSRTLSVYKCRTTCIFQACMAATNRDTFQDELFMQQALQEATVAFENGEVPIGAVIVREGVVISSAHNKVEELQDASAHAELLALRSAAAELQGWRLCQCTLYVTIEPCAMCLAAMHAFRIERLVYGAVNPRLGAVESAMSSLMGPSEHPIHGIKTMGGILSDSATELMQSFFRKRRADEPTVNKPALARKQTNEWLEGRTRPNP